MGGSVCRGPGLPDYTTDVHLILMGFVVRDAVPNMGLLLCLPQGPAIEIDAAFLTISGSSCRSNTASDLMVMDNLPVLTYDHTFGQEGGGEGREFLV